MYMSPEEINERLRRAAEARRVLRRATLKLMAFGEQLLRNRSLTSTTGGTEAESKMLSDEVSDHDVTDCSRDVR